MIAINDECASLHEGGEKLFGTLYLRGIIIICMKNSNIEHSQDRPFPAGRMSDK